MTEVEITRPLPSIPALDPVTGRRYSRARVLVRLDTEPLGVFEVPLDGEGLPPERLAAAIWRDFGMAVDLRALEAGAAAPTGLPVSGIRLGRPSPYLRERAEVLAGAPPVSVIICTRGGAEQVAVCLDSLDRQEYPDYEVVVVDNAPTSDALVRMLARRRGGVPVRRVVEPRPGLSWARDRGLRSATGQVVAYLDGDETADRYWLAEIARGFAAREQVAGVVGMIIPAALETPAQEWFEQFGGHSKGRGWTQAVFDPASHAVQHPLFPLPPFGAGGNMAFDRAVLAELGGFDVALGAGTPGRAGEDTALLSDLMLAGHTLVYQPAAFVRHHHHEDWSDLANQLYGYGVGVTAFYTHALLRDPRRLPALLRLVPAAARELLSPASLRRATMREDFPHELERLERRGMLQGPLAYLRSRRVQRHVRRHTAEETGEGRS